MGSRQQIAQPKHRESRCDKDRNGHYHRMKCHDGAILKGKESRTYGCRRKPIEAFN